MKMRDTETYMRAFEAVLSLWDTRIAVDKEQLKPAQSHFEEYLSRLNALVSHCSNGRRDFNYVLWENPSFSDVTGWVDAMRENIKTIRGDTETGAKIVAMVLDDCGCSCSDEP